MERAGTSANLKRKDAGELVEFCLADLLQAHDFEENLYKTLFYKIVRGGDTATVKMILERLQQEGNISAQNWILHGNKYRSIYREQSNPAPPKYDFLRVTVAVIMILGYLIFLPIFYPLHSIAIFIVKKYTRVMPRNCDLILMPAVLSENQDMVELFKEYGVRLDRKDKNENNIFHWLVELSKTNVDLAKRCAEILYAVYGQESCSAVNKQENFMGLTPLEFCVSGGSLNFFNFLCHKPGVMRTIAPNSNHGISRLIKSLSKVNQGLYEVTRYETGDYVKQSLILHCLRNVDVINKPADEIKVMFEDSFLCSYIKLKRKSYKIVSMLRWLQQAVFCVALFMFVADLIGGNIFPKQFQQYVSLYCKEAGINGSQIDLAMNIQSAEELAVVVGANKCLPRNAGVFGGRIFDACGTKTLQKLMAMCPSSVTEEELLIDIGFTEDGQNAVEKIQHIPSLNYLMVISCIRTLHEIIHGISIIYHFYSIKKPVSRCTWMLLSRHFPGSYINNQLSTVVRLLIIILFIIINYAIPNAESVGSMLSWVQHSTVMIAMATLINIVSVIHSFRFVPSIGQFIITMFAMCKLLIQFGIITLALQTVFSMLFMIYLRDPDCPSKPMDGYQDLPHSLYSSYFLMLGMGPIPFGNRISMYVLILPFTMSTVLILLNLIIAVMSAIASNMMEYPWDYAISSKEITMNVLESESLFKACMGPCQKYVDRLLMKRAGYQMRHKRDGTNAVYVTVYSP